MGRTGDLGSRICTTALRWDILTSAKALGGGFGECGTDDAGRSPPAFHVGSRLYRMAVTCWRLPWRALTFDIINTPEVLNAVSAKRELFVKHPAKD